MDAATTEHIISQVGRLLDAEVIHENRKHRMDELDKARAETRAYWKLTALPPNLWQVERHMSILGLESGSFQAKLAEMRKRASDARAAGLSKMDGAVTAGLAKIDAAADTVVEKVDKEVAAQIEEFASFGDNGG